MFGPSKRQLWRALREERAQHRHEIQNLLDRLADATGTPWTPSPSSVQAPPDAPVTWTASPEQHITP